jgi:hypothetical protein
MADLYGELLSNALNRKAPQNHFAAYINPDEAAMLRSQGGGVAPGGGQYMANGMPAFYSGGSGSGGLTGDAGRDPGREAAAQAAFSGSYGGQGGGGFGGGGGAVGTDVGPVDRSFATGTPSYGPQEEPGVWGEGEGSVGTAWEGAPGTWTGYENALANQKANQERLGKGYKTNFTVRQADQLAIINSNPDLTSEQRTEMFSRPISQGGTGQYSPATMLSGQGAPAGVIAHVMTPSASGGYAVNDPGSDVSVPKGYNMGFVPAAMTSLIGLASPLASLMTLPGYGLTDYIGDFAEKDKGIIGGAYNTFANMRDKMADAFSPVTNAFGDLTGTVRDGVVDFGGGLGDALSNFDSPFPDFGPSRPEVDTMGQSAADPGPDIEPINGFVNVADDSFSVTDGVVENPGEKEKEYSPIPPDILARILANVQYGRERQRIAREMG